MGWTAPFEWGSRKLYSGAGHIASWVGASDTAEFLWSTGNPHYVEKAFRQPNATTTEGRAEESAEAHRYTKNVVNHIAPNTEIAVNTAREALEYTGGTLALSPLGAIVPPLLIEAGFEQHLASAGEAPPMRIYDQIPGVNKLIGDEHYSKGGTPDTHPASKYNPANHPAPDAPTPTESFASTTIKFFKDVSQKMGMSFGAGSLIGLAVGAVIALAVASMGGSLLLGAGAVALGLMYGQRAMDSFQSTAPATHNESPAPPKPNAPRSDAPDPMQVVRVQYTPAPAATNQPTAAKGS